MPQEVSVRARNASVIRESDRENLWFLGDLLQPIITSDMTEGRFQMALHHARAGSEPPLHEHDSEDEMFYILEGEITFWTDGSEFTLGSNDAIVMPKGVPHVFQVNPGAEAKWLVMTAPGGLEKFFRAVSEPAQYAAPPKEWEMDSATEARLMKAADDFGITLFAPPGVRPETTKG